MEGRPHGDWRGGAWVMFSSLIWGLYPFYFRLLKQLPAVELLLERILFSFLALLLFLAISRRLREALGWIAKPREVLLHIVSGILISINWGLYLYAVLSDQVLAASLGYYMSPLANALLGFLLLREASNRLQKLSFLVAGLTLLWYLWAEGLVPILPLSLAISFSFYSLVRRLTPVGASMGHFLEVLFILPLAAGFWLYIWTRGETVFAELPGLTMLLVALSGPVTVIPLIMYARGMRRIKLTTAGFILYLIPTLLFAESVWIFKESYSLNYLYCFFGIWLALILYSIGLLKGETALRTRPL